MRSEIYPRCSRLAQLWSVNVVRHVNRLQKNHVIISGAAGKLLEFGLSREESYLVQGQMDVPVAKREDSLIKPANEGFNS